MVIVNTHQVLAQIPLKEIHILNMLMLVIIIPLLIMVHFGSVHLLK